MDADQDSSDENREPSTPTWCRAAGDAVVDPSDPRRDASAASLVTGTSRGAAHRRAASRTEANPWTTAPGPDRFLADQRGGTVDAGPGDYSHRGATNQLVRSPAISGTRDGQ